MRFLLDICVIADAAKATKFPRLAEWLGAQANDDLAIGALTLGEFRFGVQRLATGRRREALKRWIDAELDPLFAERVLPIDEPVAMAWALLRATGDDAGRPLPVIDGLLLATAQVHGLTFVTRNLADVEGRGVSVLSPY